MSAVWEREQREQICDTRLGARLHRSRPAIEPADRYVHWWIETYGTEAFSIARDFLIGGGLDGLRR